jgi:hypothetical protein
LPVIKIVSGIFPGATNRGASELLVATEDPPVRGVGAGSGAGRPALIGVETVLAADGSPAVFNSGKSSSKAMTSACSPNEVSVVQLRLARCAHEVSNILSANIASLNMVSSQREICLLLWTP